MPTPTLIAATTLAALLAITPGCKKDPDSQAPASQSQPTPNPTPQSPKAVRLAFSRAMSAGDVATARSLSTGDAGPQVLDTLAKLALATAQLQDALKAKFGDKATKLEIFTESPDPEDELKRSTETITGDTAVIALSPTDKNASHLKKIDGQWKFDVTMFKEAASQTPQMRKMAAAWSDLAKEVTAGKFATLDDFTTAFDTRTAAAATTGK